MKNDSNGDHVSRSRLAEIIIAFIDNIPEMVIEDIIYAENEIISNIRFSI